MAASAYALETLVHCSTAGNLGAPVALDAHLMRIVWDKAHRSTRWSALLISWLWCAFRRSTSRCGAIFSTFPCKTYVHGKVLLSCEALVRCSGQIQHRCKTHRRAKSFPGLTGLPMSEWMTGRRYVWPNCPWDGCAKARSDQDANVHARVRALYSTTDFKTFTATDATFLARCP